MTPAGAGGAWKERRESMGKTIDQVSAELRIGRKYLSGIEEGKYEGWPERVFSTGFIRTYAKYLSVPAAPVLAEYERSTSERTESQMDAQLRPGWVEREREKGSRRATYTLAAGAVLLVGVLLAWVSLRTEHRPVPPPVAAVPPPSPSPAENAARAQDNAVAAPAGAAADNGATAAPPVPAQPPAGAGAPAPAPSVAAVGGSGPLDGPFQLFLEASEQTWLMYSFDGGAPIDVTLYAGDKISIQARERITLKLGNAGGVTGTLNGRRLPPFGERGKVRKFTLGQ
ncbi:MAG: hypothetical protein OHK0028_16700 [Deltaproteobacteria bacterium]